MGAFTKKTTATGGATNATQKPAARKVAVAEVEVESADLSKYSKFGGEEIDIQTIPEDASYVFTIFGPTGVGKDSFCLTAPKPILWIETEPKGMNRARKDLDSSGVIRIPAYMPPDSGVGKEVMDKKWKDECVRVLDNLQAAFKKACADPVIKTIVMNTNTDLWVIIRGAEFGRTFQVMQYNYSQVNPIMEAFFVQARDAGKNLIMVQTADLAWEVERNSAGQKQYDDKGREKRVQSETLEGKGWSRTQGLSDIIIGMDKDKPKKLGSKVPPKFVMHVLKCGFGSGVEGRVFEGEECSWGSVMAAIRGEI